MQFHKKEYSTNHNVETLLPTQRRANADSAIKREPPTPQAVVEQIDPATVVTTARSLALNTFSVVLLEMLWKAWENGKTKVLNSEAWFGHS
ncbi:hypothetical protein RRG08_003335 [Elysia crispata]|uniref:Uncharacterized protein n=1 Tax=Elysia crispata TaxID=231223 RepID=A0AAE1AVJ5_9GAST|nr:hypothetical protein RRG08_003335 [Elysia crispata]